MNGWYRTGPGAPFFSRKVCHGDSVPELWNLERPEDVLEVAQSYVAAGADLIETNSFGGSALKLAHYGLDMRADEINEKAAVISCRAAGDQALVIASMGPTGKMTITGEVTEEELYHGFRQQAMALERGGAQALCIETMSALDEAVAAVRAARENTSCDIICTFTYNAQADGGYRTMMGVSPEETVEPILAAGADIIGSNCGNGVEQMIGIVTGLRAAAPQTPILVHANAGLPRNENGKVVYPQSPQEMAAHVPAQKKAGATIIGGCCGTTPAHITKMRQALSDQGGV